MELFEKSAPIEGTAIIQRVAKPVIRNVQRAIIPSFWKRSRLSEKVKQGSGSSSQITGNSVFKVHHTVIVTPSEEASLHLSESKFKVEASTALPNGGSQTINLQEISDPLEKLSELPESDNRDKKSASKPMSTHGVEKDRFTLSGFAIDEGDSPEEEPGDIVVDIKSPIRVLTNIEKLKVVAAKSKTVNDTDKWTKHSTQHKSSSNHNNKCEDV